MKQKNITFLALCASSVFLCIAMERPDDKTDEKIKLHTGAIVSKKKYDELWPKLKNLAENGGLNKGAQYSLYILCNGTELTFEKQKENLARFNFPTAPESFLDEETRKIILATDALSLCKSKTFQKKPNDDLDFINPADPSEGYTDDWDK